MPETPEIERMQAVEKQSQAIGEFIEWLGSGEAYSDLHGEAPVFLATRLLKPKRGYGDTPEAYENLTADDVHESNYGYLFYTYVIEDLLAKFFGIDLEKVEREKQTILAGLRNKEPSPGHN